ncbi:MAG: ATP-binding protein [Peptoanaerobacter stomatis]|uniref:ATP-binding protein n=1 Tax=Peptoanaerobacter stomatis TaxID=796937 RepID=UPI003FA155A8
MLRNSLKYRMIMIYFMLVFIAMVIVGVFINREFERYNMDNVRRDMININKNIIENMTILTQDDFMEHKEELQRSITDMPISKVYEISIIEPNFFEISASTNSTYDSKNALDVLDRNVILSTISENVVEKDIQVKHTNNIYSIKHMAFVNKDKDGNARYILYERRSLDDVDNMLSNVTNIIIRATLIALLITIILGYFVSNSITTPIKKLTQSALILSRGDFSRKVKVTSDDEIGQLGNTFNYLSHNLEDKIKALSSEKSKLNAIIYHMQNGLVAIDNFGKIIHCNANFEDMIGLSRTYKSLIGQNYDEVIKLCTDDLNFSKLIRNYSNNNIQDIIFTVQDKYYKAQSAVFKEENGALAGIIVVFQDITEARRLEELRREFVANVSHELKTPITSIKSYSETLLDGALDDRETAYDFLNVIKNESDRMNKIIKDLLQLSHIDYKKESWDMTKTDINSIVKDCINKMKLHADKKNQQIIDKTSLKPVIATVDKSKFEQVIINLISNAIKYTQEFGVIHLSTSLVDNYCEISVKDNGIGIPQKDIPFIFDRFYRVDKGRSRSLGGTGLGLSICNSIIAEHKGEIKVKSVEGKGSEFIVTIPVDNL